MGRKKSGQLGDTCRYGFPMESHDEAKVHYERIKDDFMVKVDPPRQGDVNKNTVLHQK